MTKPSALLLLLPLAIPLLAGCVLFESKQTRAMRASPDYKAGYGDGCASAGTKGANPRDSGLVRDEAAYRANKAYRAGWGTGFGACRGYQPGGNMPPPPGQGPISDDPFGRRFGVS